MNSLKLTNVMIVFFVLLTIPAYFLVKKYGRHFSLFKREKVGIPLVTDNTGVVIATRDSFKEVVNMLEKGDAGLQFVAFLSHEEQLKLYRRFIDEYIVANYVIESYIKEKKLDSAEQFKKEYEQYMDIMKNNFYSAVFQRHLSEGITIDDSDAERIYEEEKTKNPLFFSAPFTKKVPGIEGRVIKMEKGKGLAEYEERLKLNKDVTNLERINKGAKGVSPRLLKKFEEMKDGEFALIEHESGLSLAAYRVREHKGEWVAYKEVAESVKEVLNARVLEERYGEIIHDIRVKKDIKIDDAYLDEFIEQRKQEKEELLKKASSSVDTKRVKKVEKQIAAVAEKNAEKEIKEATAK